jgi:hypothetical protein
VEIGTGAARLGGLSETQHVVCRTIESHDPPKFSLSWSPDDLSGPVEGMPRESHRAASLPLQFRQASSGIEIWTGSQNSRVAGWIDQPSTDIERNLLIEDGFSGVKECPIRALRPGHIGQLDGPGNASGSLATFDGGNTASRADDDKKIADGHLSLPDRIKRSQICRVDKNLLRNLESISFEIPQQCHKAPYFAEILARLGNRVKLLRRRGRFRFLPVFPP